MTKPCQSTRIVNLLLTGRIVASPETGEVSIIRKGSLIPCKTHRENGYGRITLKDEHGYFNAKVHRIIWISVHGLPSVDLVVCHRDDNKANNRIDNLFLQSRRENTISAWENGLVRTHKLSLANKIEIVRMIQSGHSVAYVADCFNVRSETVRRTMRRLRTA